MLSTVTPMTGRLVLMARMVIETRRTSERGAPAPVAGGDDAAAADVSGVDVEPAVHAFTAVERRAGHDPAKQAVVASGNGAPLVRVHRRPRAGRDAQDDAADGAVTLNHAGKRAE